MSRRPGFPFVRDTLAAAGVPAEKLVSSPPVVDFDLFYDPSPNTGGVMNVGAGIPKKKMQDFIELGRRVPEMPFDREMIFEARLEHVDLVPNEQRQDNAHAGVIQLSAVGDQLSAFSARSLTCRAPRAQNVRADTKMLHDRTRLAPLLIVLATMTLPAAAPPQTASRAPISGIDHVVLRVTDVAGARALYRDVLGLGEEQTGPATMYRVGGRQRIVVESGLRPDEDERLLHIAFATTTLDAVAARLRGAGFEPSSSDVPLCGGRVLRIRDPDGHTIEFVQRDVRTPASSPAAPVTPAAVSSRLLHAGLTVQNAEAADRFYKDALGFSELWRGGRTDTEVDWINMRVPEGTDYLEYMLVRGAVDRRQRGVLHHICLLVPDIQEAYETVLARTPAPARGAQAPPSVGRNRRWQLNLYDADGTRIELMEPHTMR